MIYDGDEAGQNATHRAIPMLEKAGLQVKVLKMRDAKDPDEFLRKFGADRFRILLEESSNRVEYQLKAIQKKYDLNIDEERVNFITEAADFVSTLVSAVQREVYGNRAAEAAKISPEAMKIEVQKAYKRRLSREKRKQEKIDLAPARNLQAQSRQIRYDNVKFVLISPEELKIPDYIRDDVLRANNIEFEEVERLEDAIGQLDVLYMTRVQRERFFNEEDYIRLKDFYVLTKKKMELAKDDMLVLHPLPRVNEISVEVDDDPRAVYFKQVQYGVYVRMALILTLLGITV